MNYRQTTQVPNILFDTYLPNLTESELKILLVIIRQTYGWIDKYTGKRKKRDRISHSQFMHKAGLSRRILTKSIQSLLDKGLITAENFDGSLAYHPDERKGKSFLYYSCIIQPQHETTSTCAYNIPKPVHESAYNKTNYTKINGTKLRSRCGGNPETSNIGALMRERKAQLRQQVLPAVS